jgi:hypothetical protein
MAMPSWTHDAECKHESGDYCYKIMGFSTRLLEEIYQRKEENLDQLDEDSYLQERSCKSKTERLTAASLQQHLIFPCRAA